MSKPLIWKKFFSASPTSSVDHLAAYLKANPAQTLGGLALHLGIEITEVGEDFLAAKMPVREQTHQPMGLLHGGASCVLAETVGSLAGNLCCEEGSYAVGLEINANHIRGMTAGFLHAYATPLHLGKSTQVWDIQLFDSAAREKLICVSRLTLSVRDKSISGKLS